MVEETKERLLDKLDKMIDANAVVMERCLDVSVGMAQRHITPEFYQMEQAAIGNSGVYDMAIELFRKVMSSATFLTGKGEELLSEYKEEQEDARRLALERKQETAK